jgi:hypothetical protein
MPAKDYPCEFCKDVMRRDTIGQHVKSKHMTDIAERLLKEYEDWEGKPDNHSTLQKILKSMDAKNIPIYSDIEENSVYWFGLRPNLFLDDEEKAVIKYKSSPANMEAHAEFLEEITSIITMKQLLKSHISLVDRSPETIRLKAQVAEQQKLFQAQCKTILENVSLIERQRQIIKDFQEETGVDDIETLKNSLSYANKRVGWAEDEIKALKDQLNKHQSIADNEVSEINSKKLTIESQLLTVMNELGSLRTDFKKNVEKEVEKEVKKIKAQEKKDKARLKKEKAKLKMLEASSDSD